MLLQKVFATHCHFLSFLFSFFYVNMHSKSMEQHSRSYPTIYQKLGLEFWIEKKDIMQAKLPHTVLCIRTQLEFWHFLTFFCSELSGSRSGDRFEWRCNLTLLLFRQYWQTGIHDYPEKINRNFLI